MRYITFFGSIAAALALHTTMAGEIIRVASARYLPETPLAEIAAGSLMEQVASYRVANLDQRVFKAGPDAPARAPGERDPDFTADVRVAWSDASVWLRIDVTDDVVVPAVPVTATENRGDNVQIFLAPFTAGPGLAAGNGSLRLTLWPDPANGTLKVDRFDSTLAVHTEGGEIESRLEAREGGYRIWVRLPTGGWLAKPIFGGMTHLQVVFDDVDDAKTLASDSKWVLFPSTVPGSAKLAERGRIQYFKDEWLSIVTDGMLFDDSHAVKLLVNYGNMTKAATTLSIDVQQYPSGKAVKTYDNLMTLRPGTTGDAESLVLDLSDLPPGGYYLQAKSAFSPAVERAEIGITSTGVAYSISHLERRPAVKSRLEAPRSLAVYDTQNGVNEVYRYLAGRGQVLWSVGRYDGASDEFPETIRASGPTTLAVPGATDAQVPWALFAQNEGLGAMNRPLVLKLDPALFKDAGKLKPELPDWPHLSRLPEAMRLSRSGRLLLLVGLVVHQIDDQHPTEIEVRTPYQVIMHRSFTPHDTPVAGSDHVYVLRVWLGENDREIQIVNLSKDARFVEVDFMALLGAGDAPVPGPNDSTLVFQGTSEAAMFTRQVQTSRYLMNALMVDKRGVVYPSLPGGRFQGFDELATARVMSELPSWGYRREAQTMLSGALFHPAAMAGPATGFTIAKPAAISGYYNAWRHSGAATGSINILWLDNILRPLNQLQADIDTHPLGVMNARGLLGVEPETRGAATIAGFFAADSALSSGSAFALAMQDRDLAAKWTYAARRMEPKFRANFVVPVPGIRVDTDQVFPAGYGLPELRGMTGSLPTGSWVYGRYDSGRPVLYNNDIRVFDTPFIFAGLEYYMDGRGFSVDPAMFDAMEKTYENIIATSPVTRDTQFRKFGLVPYYGAQSQIWMTMAALMLDRETDANAFIRSYVRYNYDEFDPITSPGPTPSVKDAMVSPYVFKEGLNLEPRDGSSRGTSGDSLNAYHGVSALKLARLIAGIDDYDPAVLRFSPRLPSGWVRVEATNWHVDSMDVLNRDLLIRKYTYERFPNNRFSLSLDMEKPVKKLELRIGPFDAKYSDLNVTVNGVSKDVRSVLVGRRRWAVVTVEDVSKVDVAVGVKY